MNAVLPGFQLDTQQAAPIAAEPEVVRADHLLPGDIIRKASRLCRITCVRVTYATQVSVDCTRLCDGRMTEDSLVLQFQPATPVRLVKL